MSSPTPAPEDAAQPWTALARPDAGSGAATADGATAPAPATVDGATDPAPADGSTAEPAAAGGAPPAPGSDEPTAAAEPFRPVRADAVPPAAAPPAPATAPPATAAPAAAAPAPSTGRHLRAPSGPPRPARRAARTSDPDPAPRDAAAPADAPAGAQPRPEDLLAPSRPRALDGPATWGWRGRLARMSGGLYKPPPSSAERADRQARLDAQRSFSRPMTVVVVQPKGGAGKTPTTICLSSALGVRRGGYVVGWDNNETRGTLAVRTVNDDHRQTTAWDLLGRLDDFEQSGARVGDLSFYLRAQGDAQFDALVSDDNPGNMAQIGETEFRRIHSVLQRFYRMIIVDTGNNVRSPNWQAAVDHADQVVVVSTYQRDVGYSGSWVLDHLTQTGREHLARNAITVLTAAEPSIDAQMRSELIGHFDARTRSVVEVPYDPHIAEGGPIRWDELSAASQRAWTEVAAAVTSALYQHDRAELDGAGRG